MHNNVMDLIIYLAKRLHLGMRLKDISMEKMQEYNKSEISAAYSWLAQKYDSSNFDTSCNNSVSQTNLKPRHPRVLHQSERTQISSEAYGYLLELYYLRIIDEVNLERLIEYAMFRLDGKTELHDIKEWVTRMILFDGDYSNNEKSLLLKGNETIN